MQELVLYCCKNSPNALLTMLWWCKLMIYVKSECLAIAKLYWIFTANEEMYKRSRIHQKSKRNRIYKYFFASCSGDVFFCHDGQSGPFEQCDSICTGQNRTRQYCCLHYRALPYIVNTEQLESYQGPMASSFLPRNCCRCWSSSIGVVFLFTVVVVLLLLHCCVVVL